MTTEEAAVFDDLIETASALQSMAEELYSRTDSYKTWGMLPSLQATFVSIQWAKEFRSTLISSQGSGT